MKTAESFHQILQSKISAKPLPPSENIRKDLTTGVEPKNLSYLLGSFTPKFTLNKTRQNPLFKLYRSTPRRAGAPHKFSSLQHSGLDFFNSRQINLLPDFTQAELKRAYRLLALRLHPDRPEGTAQLFIELKSHYENLKKLFI
ncbi:MAG: J domain-containing protein [Bdellovibrionota bacterium]